ncbi:hypothetical protein GOP47_0028841 [Adiantum capillus-veneris]|nr:hypothetical protein GOP47_0028841 [Adiantum capillus-veneris]
MLPTMVALYLSVKVRGLRESICTAHLDTFLPRNYPLVAMQQSPGFQRMVSKGSFPSRFCAIHTTIIKQSITTRLLGSLSFYCWCYWQPYLQSVWMPKPAGTISEVS